MNIKMNVHVGSVTEAMEVIEVIDTEDMRESHPDLDVLIEVAQ